MIITVFRSRLRDDGREAYFALAPKMAELACSMPGYLSHKVFVAEDGERVTIVEFTDIASQQAWSSHIEHMAAKQLGKTAFYQSYSLQICEVKQESHFSTSHE